MAGIPAGPSIELAINRGKPKGAQDKRKNGGPKPAGVGPLAFSVSTVDRESRSCIMREIFTNVATHQTPQQTQARCDVLFIERFSPKSRIALLHLSKLFLIQENPKTLEVSRDYR